MLSKALKRVSHYCKPNSRLSGQSRRARRDVRVSVVGSTGNCYSSLSSDATPRTDPTSTAAALAVAVRVCAVTMHNRRTSAV
jgi:hypothetical protein